MTPDDDRIDLASALLDGTLPEAAAAAARRDPVVMARVAQLQQARDRVRDVPPPPVEGREAMLAAALDAFDSRGPEAPVADIGARRRARGRREAPRWLGAAAAVALVLAAVGAVAVIGQQQSDQEDQASLTRDEAATDSAGSGDDNAAEEDTGAASAEVAPAEPSPTTLGGTATQLGDLGSFDSSAALVDRLRADARVAQAPGDAAELGSLDLQGGFACSNGDIPAELRDPGSVVAAAGTADLDGTAVTVWVVDTPSGRRVVAVDPQCRTVVDRSVE